MTEQQCTTKDVVKKQSANEWHGVDSNQATGDVSVDQN